MGTIRLTACQNEKRLRTRAAIRPGGFSVAPNNGHETLVPLAAQAPVTSNAPLDNGVRLG
jgi:hypothetical protein